jgi:hypothetical protein
VSDPFLSVICTAGPRRRRAQRVMEAVAAQTAAADLELVLVDTSPDAAPLEAPPGLPTTVIPCPSAGSLGEARARGLAAARGEAVAFLADHCYPVPDWARSVIRSYRDRPVAAVGYSFVNANTDTYGSRCSMLADFGPWLAPSVSAEVEVLPPHDVSYRRSVLSGLGDQVGELLTAEPLLLEELRKRGHRFAVHGGAVARHGCLRSVGANALASFDYGRALAAIQRRREGWGIGARALHALISLFGAPALRTAQALRALFARSLGGEALRALPGILCQHALAASGQAWGYLVGGGDAPVRFLQREVADVRDDR